MNNYFLRRAFLLVDCGCETRDWFITQFWYVPDMVVLWVQIIQKLKMVKINGCEKKLSIVITWNERVENKNGKDNLPSVFPLGVTTLKALDVELLLLLLVVLLLLWWFVLLLLFNCEDKSGDICVSLEMPFNLKLIAKLKSNGIFGGGSDISIINKNATKCSQHKR